MRPITLETFKLVYIITGAKRFSYIFALIFNTILNTLFLKGMIALLMDVAPALQNLVKFFRFPMLFAPGVLLLVINIYMVPYKMVDYAGMIRTRYIKLIVYIFIVILTFLYGKFTDKYF